MKQKSLWWLGLLGILLVLIVPAVLLWPKPQQPADNPWAHLPKHPPHVDHSAIIKGPFKSGEDVTKTCLSCHPNAATDFMHTTHWRWDSVKGYKVPGHDEPVHFGKLHSFNNFCIGTRSNQRVCMKCHTGYFWEEGMSNQQVAEDLKKPEEVDCLVCHADPNLYGRGEYGKPAKGVNLVAAAKSVRNPTRDNCLKCHAFGGGGDNVKHGDISSALYHPSPDLDVHMGRYNMQCTDCHRTSNHQIKGKLINLNPQVAPSEQVQCTDCHSNAPHKDARLNAHVKSVACQTCHVPETAEEVPTKIYWDWSTAGQDRPQNHFHYLKIKGSFVYVKNMIPTYLWFNGNEAERYVEGDPINHNGVTYINKPAGSIDDPTAKIFPFKVNHTLQPYDTVYGYLLAPSTASVPNGFWTKFDWDLAFRIAEPYTGLKYSGHFAFTQTVMYWPQTHMVRPKEQALQCADCHSPNGRLDWQALGYPGDPMKWGGRFDNNP